MTRQVFNPALIKAPTDQVTGAVAGRLTVSQLTALIKQALETALPQTLHVVGEISNFKRHASGHVYFTLKDRWSELSCVMWRSQAADLKFEPANGLEVVATGVIEVFERSGRYQLLVRRLEPLGVGALELAFRQLCEKLGREGLFDPEHKRPLPAYPKRIALVTSPSGAAVADVLRTIERRYPCVQVLLYPVRVQGPGAAEDVAGAVRQLNQHAERLGGIDVMIVGRGGGSLEDLWAFNEEIVARAIYDSRIPIISGVGHETDVTVADLVADVRAATPTAAAELAVPVLDEVLAELAGQSARLLRAAQSRLELAGARFAAAWQRSPFREPMALIHRREQIVDELVHRTHRCLIERIQTARARVDSAEPTIRRISPHEAMFRRAAALHRIEQRIHASLFASVTGANRTLQRSLRHIERVGPANVLLARQGQLARLIEGLRAAIHYDLSLRGERLRRQHERLSALAYHSVLARGFSITRMKRGRAIVRSCTQVQDGPRIVTEIGDGRFESEVVNRSQLELFDST